MVHIKCLADLGIGFDVNAEFGQLLDNLLQLLVLLGGVVEQGMDSLGHGVVLIFADPKGGKPEFVGYQVALF